MPGITRQNEDSDSAFLMSSRRASSSSMSIPWPEQGRQCQGIHGWKKEEVGEKVGEADGSQHFGRERNPVLIFLQDVQAESS